MPFKISCQNILPSPYPNLSPFYSQYYHWKTYNFLVPDKQGKTFAFITLVNAKKAWVSLPHFTYGGFAFAEDKSVALPEVKVIISNIIFHKLKPGTYNLKPGKLKSGIKPDFSFYIRSVYKPDENYLTSDKLTFTINLHAGLSSFRLNLSSNLKRKIKKAKKTGLVTHHDGVKLLNDFYRVYTQSIRRLKSIPYPKSFFYELIHKTQPDSVKLFVVYKENSPIGSSVLLSNNGFHENAFFAINHNYKKCYVSDFLHWSMIEYIYQSNRNAKDHIYSFGRSTAKSGAHKYKIHWPVKTLPIYEYSNIQRLSSNKQVRKALGLLPSTVKMSIGKLLIKHIY